MSDNLSICECSDCKNNCNGCLDGNCECKYSYEYKITSCSSDAGNNETKIAFTQKTNAVSRLNKYHNYYVSIKKCGNKYEIQCFNGCELVDDEDEDSNDIMIESVLSEIVTLRTILILIDLYNSPPLINHPQSNNDINKTYNICYCDECREECSDCYIGKCQCICRDVYIVKLYNESSDNKTIELEFKSFPVSDDDIFGYFHIKLNFNDENKYCISECLNDTCFIDQEQLGYIISNTENDSNLKYSAPIDNIIKLIDLCNEYSEFAQNN